ncbi:hypothetical protein BLNAU_14764 [Blattamonas nauphoetae]|uniref:Uncharacterized protein n=1 Tax=Blattamonas nauphoetae TaxID=2049346 RepID=A0ABQ9XCN3_9EUKA|nr:hypothetical protein BLNAU_14764 [Blattamonas nauphoetae]
MESEFSAFGDENKEEDDESVFPASTEDGGGDIPLNDVFFMISVEFSPETKTNNSSKTSTTTEISWNSNRLFCTTNIPPSHPSHPDGDTSSIAETVLLAEIDTIDPDDIECCEV